MTSPVSDSASLLTRLLAIQAEQWGRGERIPVESYLQQHPELRHNPSILLALIQAEMRLRVEMEGVAPLDEYLSRFPTLQGPLREALPGPGSEVLTAHALHQNTASEREGRELHLPVIPGLELHRVIGRGGMGVVYQGVQTGLGRVCAVKVIKSGQLAAAEEIRRFRTEAAAIGRMEHPDVVRVFGYGEHEGLLYLVMEYLPGGTLAGRLVAGTMPVREAVELVRKLAGAVQAAHDRGIIHRDMKPGNVLFDAEGRAKVADFGLARLLEGGEGGTQTGTTVGTPGYMSPEQALGRTREIDRAADVWGLGAVLYACLAGHAPFRGKDQWEVVQRTCNEPPPALRERRQDVDKQLEAIYLKCLEKSPRNRYGSAGELVEDLNRWLEGQVTEAQPLGWSDHASRWVRQQPRRAFLGAMLGAVPILGAVSYWGWPMQDTAAEALKQELTRGRGADLFDQKGQPRHALMLVGAQTSNLAPHVDGSYTVGTQGLCLIQLAQTPGVDRFRLEGEICHRRDGKGKVGLFACHQATPFRGRMTHTYVCAWFSDLIDEGGGWDLTIQVTGNPPPGQPVRPINSVHLFGSVFAGEGWDDLSAVYTPQRHEQAFVPNISDKVVWRSFGLEVTPLGVSGLWGPRAVAGLASQAIRESLQTRCQEDPRSKVFGFQPGFSPRGAVGLYVSRGVASFRNVRIVPLPRA